MRILIVTDRLSTRGGADLHLLDVIQALLERGVEVELACGRGAVPAPRPANPPSITRIKALSSAIPDLRQLPRLDPLLERADLIHVQNVMNPEALRRLVNTGRAVVTVQDHRFFCPGPGRTLPDGRPCDRPMSAVACAGCLPDAAYRERSLDLTRARRDALKGARLVVLSQYMAASLAEAGLPGARIIPPWLQTPQLEPVVGQGFVLGGRLVEHKGVDLAARAWELAGVSAQLHLAGEGPLAARLPGAIHHGWLEREALWTLLHGARALLFPSRWQEPFGILAVEALSLGTPVIRTPGGGTDDWAEAGVITVPAGDAEAMARALQRLDACPDEASSLGRQGQAAVRSRFARAPLEQALMELYALQEAG